MQFIKKLFSIENITLFLIVVFCTRYIPLDSRAGVSMFKVAVACLCPFLALYYKTHFSKAHIIALVYYIYIWLTAYAMHPHSFRISTVLYLLSFLIVYCTFYSLIYEKHCLTLNRFCYFLKCSIIIATILLFVQQLLLIAGIRYFPLLNMSQVLNRGIGANSLFGEPSVFARVLTILFYAYLKCNEYKNGKRIEFDELFREEHKWVFILFLWSMLTMGSGTAFICLAVMTLYFLRGVKVLLFIPIISIVFVILSYLGIESFERAKNVSLATTSGDAELVMKTDGSAASRIKPMLNTLSIDLTKADSWFGRGCDSGIKEGTFGNERYLGEISDYGLIAYILGLVLVFTCSIRFLSIPTLLYFMGIGGGTGNIPYAWGILMLLTGIRYFSEQKDNDEDHSTYIIIE